MTLNVNVYRASGGVFSGPSCLAVAFVDVQGQELYRYEIKPEAAEGR